MDGPKWLILGSNFVLILLPAAIHYRNLKHADKRTNLHKRITKTSLALWVMAACGMGWANYTVLSRPEKAPSFTFFVNGMQLSEGAFVSIPYTSGVQCLTFDVKNTGTLNAQGITLQFLTAPQIRVTSSTGWSPAKHGPENKALYLVHNQSLQVYDTVRFPPIKLLAVNEPVVSTIILRCSAPNTSGFSQVNFYLKNSPEIEHSKIEYP